MKTSQRILLGVLLVAFGAVGIACEENTSSPYAPSGSSTATQLTSADNDFIQKSSSGGRMEVALAQLAVDKASNTAVKSFANRMVQDHSRANDELTQLVSRLGGKLPAPQDATEMTMTDRFSNLKGAEFDRAFMSQMVGDHTQVVSDFERYSANGQNSDLRAWASKTLPTLREHLQLARSTADSIGAIPMTSQ